MLIGRKQDYWDNLREARSGWDLRYFSKAIARFSSENPILSIYAPRFII